MRYGIVLLVPLTASRASSAVSFHRVGWERIGRMEGGLKSEGCIASCLLCCAGRTLEIIYAAPCLVPVAGCAAVV